MILNLDPEKIGSDEYYNNFENSLYNGGIKRIVQKTTSDSFLEPGFTKKTTLDRIHSVLCDDQGKSILHEEMYPFGLEDNEREETKDEKS